MILNPYNHISFALDGVDGWFARKFNQGELTFFFVKSCILCFCKEG
jgi:hypothetical protein